MTADRREFLRTCLRWACLGGLGGLTYRLAGRSAASGGSDHACGRAGLCAGCGRVAGCLLPQAQSFRAVRERRTPHAPG